MAVFKEVDQEVRNRDKAFLAAEVKAGNAGKDDHQRFGNGDLQGVDADSKIIYKKEYLNEQLGPVKLDKVQVKSHIIDEVYKKII